MTGDTLAYSIICPAHRADANLAQALQSTLEAMKQGGGELIVVANGPEREAIASFVLSLGKPGTVRVILSEIPSLIYSLNRGVEASRGEFVARMDADDICLPDRFDRQLELIRRSGSDVIASSAEVIDANGEPTGGALFASVNLWRSCGVIHPAVMIRRSMLLELGGYGNLEHSEDYHLWLRARARGFNLSADSSPAIRYRIHSGQSTDRSRVIHTFATNAGMKIGLALRHGKPAYLFGAFYDIACYFYNVCRRAFL